MKNIYIQTETSCSQLKWLLCSWTRVYHHVHERKIIHIYYVCAFLWVFIYNNIHIYMCVCVCSHVSHNYAPSTSAQKTGKWAIFWSGKLNKDNLLWMHGYNHLILVPSYFEERWWTMYILDLWLFVTNSVPCTTQSWTRVSHVHCQFHELAILESYIVWHTTVAFTIHFTWFKIHTVEMGT